MIKQLVAWWKKLKADDPVYSCELNLAEPCTHVDGPLCDFPDCSMLTKWKIAKARRYGGGPLPWEKKN